MMFLGALVKLRKATISFLMSVRPSARNNSAPTGRIFMKFDIWALFEYLSRNFKFHYKPTSIPGTCRRLQVYDKFFPEWQLF